MKYFAFVWMLFSCQLSVAGPIDINEVRAQTKKFTDNKSFDEARKYLKNFEVHSDKDWCNAINEEGSCNRSGTNILPELIISIESLEKCAAAISKSDSKNIARNEIDLIKQEIEKSCGKDLGSNPPDWVGSYEKVVKDLEERRGALPFVATKKTPLVLALVAAQNKCYIETKNRKWTYTTPLGYQDHLKPGTYFKTWDDCRSTQLNNEDFNSYGCTWKYFGPKITADIIKADIIVQTDSIKKVPLYFSSMEICEAKLSKPFTYRHPAGTEFTIENLKSTKPSKVIKNCRKETLTLCDPKENHVPEFDEEFSD